MGDAGAAIHARALGKRYGRFDALDGKAFMDVLPSFLALIGFGVALLALASVTLKEAD